MKRHGGSGNLLLRELTPAEYDELDAEHVPLEFKEVLFEEKKPITHAYFPLSGVVSLVSYMEDEALTVESGTIGREGLVGVPGFLGAKVAPNRAFVQVPGDGLRMPTKRLIEAAERNEALRQLILLYTNALMAMVAQSAACNRAHPVDARAARWLLMTHDRVNGDQFPMTQEFLGQMLGVRRPAVNAAGVALQSAGLIQYVRGRITILDRRALEKASCECYSVVSKQMSYVRRR